MSQFFCMFLWLANTAIFAASNLADTSPFNQMQPQYFCIFEAAKHKECIVDSKLDSLELSSAEIHALAPEEKQNKLERLSSKILIYSGKLFQSIRKFIQDETIQNLKKTSKKIATSVHGPEKAELRKQADEHLNLARIQREQLSAPIRRALTDWFETGDTRAFGQELHTLSPQIFPRVFFESLPQRIVSNQNLRQAIKNNRPLGQHFGFLLKKSVDLLAEGKSLSSEQVLSLLVERISLFFLKGGDDEILHILCFPCAPIQVAADPKNPEKLVRI